MTIFVSAGHNPRQKGAKFEDKFVEYNEAVIWQGMILNHLKDFGIEIATGRLELKVARINKLIKSGSAAIDTPIAIEIHFNSAKSERTGLHIGTGCETLYYTNSHSGRTIANEVQDAMVKAMKVKDRGVKQRGDLYFLKKTNCPAIIIEPEFVQHYDLIHKYRKRACLRIAQALFRAQGYIKHPLSL